MTKMNNSTSVTETKGKKIFGVHFAPFDTPLERRLQTFAVLLWIFPFLVAPFGAILLLYIFFYTNYSWISSAYLVHWLYDRQVCNRGGRAWPAAGKWKIWKKFCDYFPIQLIKTAELDPSKNYLFAYHPHGFLATGAFGCFNTDGRDFSKLYPGIRPHLLTLEMNFRFPLIREYFLMTTACSASRESMNYLLSRPQGGHAAILVPGGAPESLELHRGTETKIHLNRRKGFIKVAIQNGSPLVPVYGFGETDIYDQLPNPDGSTLRAVQNSLEKWFGVAPVALLGRGVFQYSWGVLPTRNPINVVVGAPIEIVQNSNPTQEEIDATHARYCKAVLDLFNTHKNSYGYDDHTLTFL